MATPEPSEQFRIERDALGEYPVPRAAYYGIHTARAIENFPISGLRASPELIRSTLAIKKAAAAANVALGRLPPHIGSAIEAAVADALDGRFDDQFVVDVYQAGAGTSHNMNVNEVLANRAAERLGGARGSYDLVHPNDHVNLSQSTNDVYPSAVRLTLLASADRLTAVMGDLVAAFERKSVEFRHVLKTGRTHLQDAVPIMPGKVNPSILEMVNQVCFQIRGCDHTAALAADAGQLELNVMMPVMAFNVIFASSIACNAMETLRTRAIEGLAADAARARELLDRSTATATALSPYLGYALTAQIAKDAARTGRTIRELVLERGLLGTTRLDAILSVENMTSPGVAGQASRPEGTPGPRN